MCKVLCLPLVCLRWLIIVTGAIIILLGALVIWLGFRLQDEELMDAIDMKYIGYVIIALGAWLLLVGLLGALGAYFRNVCALILYAKFIITTSLVLIAFGGLGLHLSQKMSDALNNGESDCKGNDYLSTANDVALLANSQICTSVCPCDPDVMVFGVVRYATMAKGSATRIQDCNPCESLAPEMSEYRSDPVYCEDPDSSDFKNEFYSSSERRYFSFLSFLERKFDCAGVCEDVPYFAFTDINDGVPSNNCREDLADWIEKYPMRYSAVVLCIGVVLLVNVFAAYCVACHPNRSSFGGKGYRTPK